jgi:hypothetical protein
LPVSGPSGSAWLTTVAVPTFEAGGQPIGFRVPRPNWASVHAARPSAAEALRPIPAGRVTRAVRIVEVSWPAGFGSTGSFTSVTAPAGASTSLVPGSTPIEGLKGMVAHSFGLVPGGSGDSTNGDPAGNPGSGFCSESARA